MNTRTWASRTAAVVLTGIALTLSVLAGASSASASSDRQPAVSGSATGGVSSLASASCLNKGQHMECTVYSGTIEVFAYCTEVGVRSSGVFGPGSWWIPNYCYPGWATGWRIVSLS